MADYAQWKKKLDPDSDIRLMRRPERFARWIRRDRYRTSLRGLLYHHRHSIVALSYSTGCDPSEDEIEGWFRESFAHVAVHATDYTHALRRSAKRELLYIGWQGQARAP